MSTVEIHLNDFDSFDRFCFGDEPRDWGKYYHYSVADKCEVFTPPISLPKTEAEYQLDHYAMWMVMAMCTPDYKPVFADTSIRPYSRCYACQYKNDRRGFARSCVVACPVFDGCDAGFCTKEYRQWAFVEDSAKPSGLAEKIARTHWKNFEEEEDKL